MAISKQSVTLTQQGGGTYTLAVGPETFTFDVSRVRALWDGARDLEHLLFQVFLVLVAAGVNPHNATFASVKAAVEAQTYYWGG